VGVQEVRLGQAGTARAGDYNFFLFNSYPRVTDHLGEQGVDGRIILSWIFRK
jgi:hypothetical protein